MLRVLFTVGCTTFQLEVRSHSYFSESKLRVKQLGCCSHKETSDQENGAGRVEALPVQIPKDIGKLISLASYLALTGLQERTYKRSKPWKVECLQGESAKPPVLTKAGRRTRLDISEKA
jgi:hypothetical protein